MSKAYDEIMRRITVTQEMETRILAAMAQQAVCVTRAPKKRFYRYLSVAACLVLLIVAATTLTQILPQWQKNQPNDLVTQSDIEEVDSLQELSARVDFEVSEIAQLPFAVTDTSYVAYESKLAEINYEGAQQTATYRMSEGMQDNSGDYTVYQNTTKISVDEFTVTLKGDAEYTLALWSVNDMSYSLRLSSGISVEEWRDLISAIYAT